MVVGGTRFGTNVLADSIGYTYTVKGRTDKKTTWLCSSRARSCTARVIQPLGTNTYIRNHRPHTHRPNSVARHMLKYEKTTSSSKLDISHEKNSERNMEESVQALSTKTVEPEAKDHISRLPEPILCIDESSLRDGGQPKAENVSFIYINRVTCFFYSHLD